MSSQTSLVAEPVEPHRYKNARAVLHNSRGLVPEVYNHTSADIVRQNWSRILRMRGLFVS